MVDLSTGEAAQEWIIAQGQNDFGQMWSVLSVLFFNIHGWPVGITHVSYFDQLFDPALDENDLSDLTVIYVYLAAAFFCVDHVCDGDTKNIIEPLGSHLLLAKAIRRLEIISSRQAGLSDSPADLVGDLFVEFTQAMIAEKHAKSQHRPLSEADERRHVVGRSWLVIFMIKIVRIVKQLPPSNDNEEVCKDMIFYLQLGDDWGDWREDYRSGNWSTFLRDCVQHMGRPPKDENELERFIYLSGAYERWGKLIMEGLHSVAQRLQEMHGERAQGLLTVVNRCHDQAKAVILNFENVKAGKATVLIPSTLQ